MAKKSLTKSFAEKGKMLRQLTVPLISTIGTKNKLPPGNFSRYDKLAFSDRLFLIQNFERYGEIFKTIWNGQWLICVVGLKTSRQMLTENQAKLRAVSIELKHLFPKGFLRTMRGETHRKYRSYFVNALKFEFEREQKIELLKIITTNLNNFSKLEIENPKASVYQKTLNEIATGLLLKVFFGIEFNSADFKFLMSKFHQLGPEGLVWTVDKKQQDIYREIHSAILDFIKKRKDTDLTNSFPCVLNKLIQKDTLDETVIGNLIYMVEMGRFDMYSLFRWLTKFLVDNPLDLKNTNEESAGFESLENPIWRAFVLETLRLEQSEGLIRRATEDFVFGGYFIPKGTAVRLCLWEPHKFAHPFSEPFKFDPERFINNTYGIEQYAPFGLDQHRCPAGDLVVELSSLFIQNLVREFEIECISDGPPKRGVYHWQPNEKFTVRLKRKVNSK
jgi:cytochrome P450